MTEVYIASAFSSCGTGGNRAGVVLPGHRLSREEMQRTAAALNFSETVFLSPTPSADYRLEYFTPTEEVPLCGHATIAAFVVLSQLGLLEKSEYIIQTKAGFLRVYKETDGVVFMEQSLPQFGSILSPEELASSLPAGVLSRSLPIQILSTGLRDILVPMASLHHLTALTPDFAAMTCLSRDKQVVGVHAFALSEDGQVTAVCRNFAPLYGIDEESATGTSNCALACYLFRLGIRPKEYLFAQGDGMGCPSRIRVRIDAQGDSITGVMVGGEGYVISTVSI